MQKELRQATRALEQSKAALGTAEKRVAGMREEQNRDRRRLAELSAGTARLERRNYELEQHLVRARAELARQARVERTLRQQRDQHVRRVRELAAERQALHASLARANGEIRRLRSNQSPNQGRMANLHYRGAVAARELEELRRYNGFLLQERGNLQAWLEESNAVRAKQQEALGEAEREVARMTSAQSSAQALNRKLQSDLDATGRELADVKTSRNALAEEIESLSAESNRLAEAERSRSEQLEKALAHASSLAEAHDAMSAEIERRGHADADVAALRAALDEAGEKIARLKIAKDYLVEKIEACTSEQRSSSTASMQRALMDALMRSRIETVAAARARGPMMTTQWPAAPAVARLEPARLMTVASTDEDTSKSTRHERELDETRQKLKELQREHDALVKQLETTQSECAAVKEQVETLTWANKELVKELDTAYASREAGMSAPLPKGTRGIYVLRAGESLSRVAKAFYGEPDRWKDIVAANKEKIPDPDMVKAGTIILIPE
jgi:chromosome segregation ATPase